MKIALIVLVGTLLFGGGAFAQPLTRAEAVARSLDANPQVAKDLQTLQRPLTDLSAECKLPVAVPQILGLLQGAQQGGGLPGSLPGSLPGAQSVGMPATSLPAQSSPASAVVQGTGPLPGPITVATR